MGCHVTIVERGERLLKREDPELTDLLTGVLTGEGVEIITGTTVERVERNKAGRTVFLSTKNDATRSLSCTEILAAVGRRANTEGLHLAGVGVELDAQGNIRTDDTGRTTTANIWACGDVAGRFPFSHLAEHEAKILVRNILFPGIQKVPYDIVPWATFTDPELARVGLTEAEAREKYGDSAIQILRHEFRQDDRAIVEERTTGLVKVIVAGRNGNVVGAHILGPQAGEMIHEWVLALRHKLPVRAIADLIHVYPTVSVSNQRAAQKWYAGVMAEPLVKGTLRNVFGFHPGDVSGWG